MILKASQRSGAKALGRHLLNAQDNEHVEVHEVRGFVAEDLMGAMNEAQALAQGTRCKQHLFSVSLNPPQNENVRTEVFETALDQIEERMGLTGHPRMVVFHEKEGRRHAHAVWSRIDADTMTAKNLPFFKTKLREISRQLYLDNGWKMPRGLMDSKQRDPRNFNLAEWQQAKRAGLKADDLKGLVQDSWSISENAQSFALVLEERGLFLAKGDRRGHVAVSYEGEVFSIAKMTGKRATEVVAKLGDPDGLRSVEDTLQYIGQALTPRLQNYIKEAKRIAANQLKPLEERKHEMKISHQRERQRLDAGQSARRESEARERAARLPSGFSGIWHRITGEYAKIKSQNEAETFFCFQRDREQRSALVVSQLNERQALQTDISFARDRAAKQVLALYRDASKYRQMGRGEQVEQTPGRGQRGNTPPRPRGRGLELG